MTLAIYCAGGLGSELIGFARSINRWDRIIFVDDVTDAEIFMGAPVYRWEAACTLQEPLEFIIATGEPAGREKLYHKIKEADYPLATLISPYASVCTDKIGEGCVISDASQLSVNVCIGNNVLINGRSVIGHDTCIGNNSIIGTQTFIGGHSIIEGNVYISPGALIKDSVTIHRYAIIGLGAVIVKNVHEEAIMFGNPAKTIGENVKHSVFAVV